MKIFLMFLIIIFNTFASNEEFFKAVEKNRIDLVKEFLNKKIDINMQDKKGNTPLMLSNNYVISKLLLKYGGNPNHQNKSGNTALIYAENTEIIKLLLENGADLEIKNNSTDTAIYTANIEKIKILAQYGADLEAKSSGGYTALMWSLLPEVTQVLIDVGANIYAVNDHGEDIITFYTKEANDEHDTYGIEEMLEMIKIVKSYMCDYKILSKIIANYSKEKNLEKTIKGLEKSNIKTMLKYKPKYFTDTQYIQILNDYGYFLSETDRYKEAIPILERVILLEPNRVVAYLNLGDCYLKDYQKSKKQFDKDKVIVNYKKYVTLLKKDAKIPDRVKTILELK